MDDRTGPLLAPVESIQAARPHDVVLAAGPNAGVHAMHSLRSQPSAARLVWHATVRTLSCGAIS